MRNNFFLRKQEACTWIVFFPNTRTRFLSISIRLYDTNFESLENLVMLYIVRKVLASSVEFSDVDDFASCVKRQHMIFVTKRVVAKTAAGRVW